MTVEKAKKAAALAALELIENGMVVGLGTGTTTRYFIDNLILRVKNGLKIQTVASSKASEQLARANGIPLLDMAQVESIDLMVDGADEIDKTKKMIKGGGGALVREKILASLSKEMVVIIDDSKKVDCLGKAKLPVEIIPFGALATERHLETLGYSGAWRKLPSGGHFVTDNHNYILDLHFDTLRTHPKKDHEAIKRVAGVVDTGFFFDLAGRVIIGRRTGETTLWN
jgi:ribose 5-phosphate isomerase A